MPLPRGGRALIELTDLRDAARAPGGRDSRREQVARLVLRFVPLPSVG